MIHPYSKRTRTRSFYVSKLSRSSGYRFENSILLPVVLARAFSRYYNYYSHGLWTCCVANTECHKYTETSFPAIGDKFGGRDHSTVIHASKTIEKKIKEDPYMRTTIEKRWPTGQLEAHSNARNSFQFDSDY